MIDRTANLLGALGLAITDRIDETARAILSHSGETPAALVVIGYGLGPSTEKLRRILRLSHPGTVRLVDRLVGDGLVERVPPYSLLGLNAPSAQLECFVAVSNDDKPDGVEPYVI